MIVDRVLEHSEEYRMLLSRADAIYEAISKKGVAPSLPANGEHLQGLEARAVSLAPFPQSA